MSALDNLTSQPFTPPAADTGGAVSKLMATNPPTQGGISTLLSKPFVPPVQAPASSPYFQAKDTKTGAFMGISDQTDPYSGRPYFAYQLPGEATTTDTTRTAPKTDPRVATTTPRADFTNPRMPESASQAIRKEDGASAADQLDHRMALAVGGSNDNSNLKLIPTDQNQAAGKDEGQLSSDIASGKISLFDAQVQEAKSKGLPTPWVDASTPPAKANLLTSIFRSPDNSVLGVIRNTILGLPQATMSVIGGTGQTNPQGLQNINALSNKVDSILSDAGNGADSLQILKKELDNTKVDTSSQTSVDSYNSKVNLFNAALQSANFKSAEAQKIAADFSNAVDAYNKSVIPSSGIAGFITGIAQGFKEQYTNPSPLEQSTEAMVTLPPIFKAPAVAIARTFEPMLEPLINDISASFVFNNPHLYDAFISNVAKNGPNGFTQNITDATQKTPLQVIGDTTQAVLAAYMPELPAMGIADAEVKQSIVKALPGIFLHGAVAGTTFGAAQAASSGITDPKELAAIVLKNTLAGGFLNLLGVVATHGGIHAAAPVIKAIQERLPENLYEAQRGFVRNPFPVPEDKLSPEEMKTGTEPTDESKIVNNIDTTLPKEEKVQALVQLSKDNAPVVDKFLKEVDAEYGTESKSSFKKPENILSKSERPSILEKKPWFDVEHIRDSFRFKTVVTNLKQIPDIVNKAKAQGWEMIKSDTSKVLKPTEWGWRIASFDMRMPNGQMVEYYLPFKELEDAKKGGNHELFEKWRNQTADFKAAHADEYFSDLNKSRQQYQTAWEKYLQRTGQDESAVRASWTKEAASLASDTGNQLSLRSSASNGGTLDHAPSAERSAESLAPKNTQIRPSSARSTMGAKSGSDISPIIHQNGIKSKEGSSLSAISKGKLGDPLADLASSARNAKEFSFALTPDEVDKVYDAVDPDRVNYTPEEAAKAYYENVRANVLPADKGAMQHVSSIKPSKTLEKTNPTLAHNGGFEPPENKGILTAPEIDWTTGKDIAAARLSTDTMERNVEKIFPKDTAKTINEFLVEHVRKNETDRVRYVNDLRADIKRVIVDKLDIKARSRDSELLQQYGEGRISLTELKQAAPKNWDDIVIAKDYMRSKYDKLLDHWNRERSKAGLKPITKRPNYFRHFVEISDFASKFGFDFKESNLPTAISGITDYFKSQTPWASAAMRRVGSFTTDDAVSGLDNYLDTASRAIFHTDSVQRGRLMEKYLRGAADANSELAIKAIDESKPEDAPPPIKLPNFAANLNDWVNIVSGKQARLDRAIESVLGRPALGVMRTLTRRFGLNVIGGNLSAAVTHAIPLSYTLATVEKGAAFQGLLDTLHSPFLEDKNTIAGQESAFLTRRFSTQEIQKTTGEKVATAMMAPFHAVDMFISRFAVSAKYMEGVSKGLDPKEAMRQADNYAGRVIGDRSVGNLPTLMSTKTLGLITQFQIEVNDNLHVLLHDVPKWNEGDKVKIANIIVQFAIYSFLFNQTMQFIKGSGKGLDPIDLGLTLAGVNDEGHDKTIMQRLALAGGDFLKELPFTSLLNGGQIPALEPIKTAVTDAASGKELKALTGILASFASPVGGGQQLQKSLTGIQAWQQGVVKDSNGNVIAIIPRTVPQLLQGAVFGQNAFPEVKAGKSEVANLDATIKQQQALGAAKNQQAQDIWDQLKGLDPAVANQQLKDIAAADPDMAKRVLKAASDEAAGITKQDTLIKTLGVASGARAQYIVSQMQSMSTNDEKKAYLSDLAKKGLLSATVLDQVFTLMKK